MIGYEVERIGYGRGIDRTGMGNDRIRSWKEWIWR